MKIAQAIGRMVDICFVSIVLIQFFCGIESKKNKIFSKRMDGMSRKNMIKCKSEKEFVLSYTVQLD